MANHLGHLLYVSAALPATNNDTGFEALTWTLVNGVQQLPQLGFNHSMIEVGDLASGVETAEKGAGRGADTTIMCREITADAGQVILRAQGDDDDGLISVKLAKPTGAGGTLATGDVVQYAQGLAHSLVDNQGNLTSYEGFQIGFRQNAKTVTDTEPA